MPIRTYPKSQMTEAQRIAHEDRKAIRNSIARMSQGYNSRRREDALNYEDSVALELSRRAKAEAAAASTAEVLREPQEQMEAETAECDEEETAAPAP